MKRYRQEYAVDWLGTDEGTIWIKTGNGNYILPEDPNIVETELGVSLDLLYDDDLELFKPI